MKKQKKTYNNLKKKYTNCILIKAACECRLAKKK